ncbi:hypothetical protein OH77DRAFT_1418258 [Trametes cingulata]|nr:hypothetical protein OH77DRAFT_1418258 [Trametes cingulata]
MMQSGTALVLLDVVLALAFLWLAWRVLRPLRASPPGPRGLPFVGVAYQIPEDKQWLKFHEWTLRYGTCWRRQHYFMYPATFVMVQIYPGVPTHPMLEATSLAPP